MKRIPKYIVKEMLLAEGKFLKAHNDYVRARAKITKEKSYAPTLAHMALMKRNLYESQLEGIYNIIAELNKNFQTN